VVAAAAAVAGAGGEIVKQAALSISIVLALALSGSARAQSNEELKKTVQKGAKAVLKPAPNGKGNGAGHSAEVPQN